MSRILAVIPFVFTLHAANGISFEPNLGQTGSGIDYVVRTASAVVFITNSGIIVSGTERSTPAFELLGANASTKWIAEGASGETISYFIGRDPSKWVEDIPHYQRLRRQNVYPGVDLLLYGAGDSLEYDFLVRPHSDASLIRLKLPGAQQVSIDKNGDLVVQTEGGSLRHHKPVLAEFLPDGSQRRVQGEFKLLGPDVVGFSVSDHDPALALSIDPVLASSTYFGGHGNDEVIATDGNGTIVGNTTSIDVPGAAFSRRAGTSVFIQQSKQTLVIGCSGNVTATSASFSFYGGVKAAVGGYTDCPDLPANIGAYSAPLLQSQYGGGATDGFLMLMYPRGNQFYSYS